MQRLLRRAAISCLLGISIILTWIGVARIIERLTPERSPITIEKGMSVTPQFPVLVLSPDRALGRLQARIVFKPNVDDYISKIQDCTFLVPVTSLSRINDDLGKQVLSAARGYSGPGRVDVLKNTGGRQYLKVTASWGSDHTYMAWYVATPKAYQPKRFLHHSAIGRRVDSLVTSIPITLVLWVTGIPVYRFVRSRKAISRVHAKP